MASYKQTCMNCNTLIDRDANFCPSCGSISPFGYHCPTCLNSIIIGQKICSSCGRELYIKCPHCESGTFVKDYCDACGKSLMIKCSNKRCGALQFFENKTCTACGKKIKVKITDK